MKPTAFIFDQGFNVVFAGSWEDVERRALRMLASLRQHGNAAQAGKLSMCRLYSDNGWRKQFRQPAELRKWLQGARTSVEAPVVFPLTRLNPHAKATAPIPRGLYCYRPQGVRYDAAGKPLFQIQPCPYLSAKRFGGVRVPWCSFLRAGSIPNNLPPGGARKLLRHFGSQAAIDAALPLFLLWDQCKECAIKQE